MFFISFWAWKRKIPSPETWEEFYNVLKFLHSSIKSLAFAFQKVSFRHAKGHESECKSLPFKSQLVSL